MGFIYYIEKKKFDEDMERQERFYRKHGMDPEAIEVMKKYDYVHFKKERIIKLHEQPISSTTMQGIEDESTSVLMKKFITALSISDDEERRCYLRHWWIQDIESTRMLNVIYGLSDELMDVLERKFFDGLTQKQIAKEYGVSDTIISRRVQVIKRAFYEWYK